MELAENNRNLNVQTITHVNILLLGERGAGKSTFINSFFNYLNNDGDFLNAERCNNLQTLIPSMFCCFDQEGDKRIVMVGSETDNERLTMGDSGTQGLKTYSLKFQDTNTLIQLIDTPGIDTEGGMEKNDANCESILSYISSLKELHAILFVLKSKTIRFHAVFKYCVQQILSRLEKSVCNNLVFVLTNTRNDDYLPGENFKILQRVVREMEDMPPYVKIPLNNNVFCFDNEAFRYLAASKKGIEFFSRYREYCKNSWEQFSKECCKMTTYIEKLSPHLVQNTAAIIEACRMIWQLSQPITDILQLINDNLCALESHRARLSFDNHSFDEMKESLFIPVLKLNVIKLRQPATVCMDAKCAELYKVGGVNKWHCKKPCDDPCYLQNVVKEIVGSPELINCAAMNTTTHMCDKCSHHYSVHMHIYYMTKTVQDKQMYTNINGQPNCDRKDVVENKKEFIKSIDIRKQELDVELKVITRCNAQFVAFLHRNALKPFRDSYPEYIQHLINREKSLGDQANLHTIGNLYILLSQHNMLKNFLDGTLEKTIQSGSILKATTPEGIQESIKELYNLKHNGEKMKKLYDIQIHSRQKEYSRNEYVHPSNFSNTCFGQKNTQKDFYKIPQKRNQKDWEKYPENHRSRSGSLSRNMSLSPSYHHSDNRLQTPHSELDLDSSENIPQLKSSSLVQFSSDEDIYQSHPLTRDRSQSHCSSTQSSDSSNCLDIHGTRSRNLGNLRNINVRNDSSLLTRERSRSYSSLTVPEGNVDNQSRPIRVNFTLPHRDGASEELSTKPNTEHRQRDTQNPSSSDLRLTRSEAPYYPTGGDPDYLRWDLYNPPRNHPEGPSYYPDPHYRREDYIYVSRFPYERERSYYYRDPNQSHRENDSYDHQGQTYYRDINQRRN